MTYRILITLAISFLAFSCVPENGSEEFLAPEIVASEAFVDGTSAVLICTISMPRSESVGFVYWSIGGEKRTVICELSGTDFRTTLNELSSGTTYYWYAFIRAGESEIRSEQQEFSTPDKDPEVKGINIPDPYFKRYLIDHFDYDSDGQLSEEEGLVIKTISVVTDKISSLKGIEYFKNLDSLICRGSSNAINDYEGHPGLLDTLDVSSNKKLRHLACDGNLIRMLDVSRNPFLEELIASWNLLEEIDLSGASKLRIVILSNNSLTGMDLKGCPSLKEIHCQGNQIKELDVSMLDYLRVLDCSPMDDQDGNNLLKKISVSVGQDIQNVTIIRDGNYVPEGTSIVAISSSGTIEGYGGTEHDP